MDDRDTVDSFWRQKDWVYRNIINSQEGILSDFACRVFMRRNLGRIDEDCFFLTESEMFKRTPGLRQLLTSDRFDCELARLTSESVDYRERHYYVDPSSDFFERRDEKRYRHSRVDRSLDMELDPENLKRGKSGRSERGSAARHGGW